MQVGTALSILAQPGRPDAALFNEHMALGDLAEPLGFDSLFALEHHFTGYSMSPAPLQLLSYYAGRTKRITLGTCVIVLPWHDPIRVAEQIALLDVISGGRTLMGFGRGAATHRIPRLPHPNGGGPPRFVEVRPTHHQGAGARIPSTGTASSTRSRGSRSARGRSPTPNAASTPPPSAPKSPRSWRNSASAC